MKIKILLKLFEKLKSHKHFNQLIRKLSSKYVKEANSHYQDEDLRIVERPNWAQYVLDDWPNAQLSLTKRKMANIRVEIVMLKQYLEAVKHRNRIPDSGVNNLRVQVSRVPDPSLPMLTSRRDILYEQPKIIHLHYYHIFHHHHLRGERIHQ